MNMRNGVTMVNEHYLVGISKLRKGSLAFIVLTVLVIALIVGFAAVGIAHVNIGRNVATGASAILPALVASLATGAVIAGIITVFVFIVSAFDNLRKAEPRKYATPYILTLAGAVGTLVFPIVTAVSAIFTPVLIIPLGYLTRLFYLLFNIGLAVGLWRLGKEVEQPCLEAAGILFAISAILTILSITVAVASLLLFIAWILTYVGSRRVEKKLA